MLEHVKRLIDFILLPRTLTIDVMSTQFTKPQPILDKSLLQSGAKTSSAPRIMGIWLAANLVVTTMLTGTLFVPSLTYGTALLVITLGTLLGALVLVTVGSIGTRTGYATMELTKFSFGIKGSLIPAMGNIVVLMGWSWVQAILAGVTVNALVAGATGYSNPVLWSVICEAVVVALALFGHSAIAKVEPVFAVLILACMGYVLWLCFKEVPLSSFLSTSATEDPYTSRLAFDAVFATAISWTVLSADFNRFGSHTAKTSAGSFIGYCTSTILAMSLGSTLALYLVIARGVEAPFDPVPLVEAFGPALAVAVFLSVMATNSMVVYGMVNSAMTVLPSKAQNYKVVASVIGLISILGASQIALLDYFTNFLLLIGAFFVPVFAVMICDYYLVKRGEYLPLTTYRFAVGYPAVGAWALGSLTAWIFAYHLLSPIGATMTSFLVTALVYLVIDKVASTRRS